MKKENTCLTEKMLLKGGCNVPSVSTADFQQSRLVEMVPLIINGVVYPTYLVALDGTGVFDKERDVFIASYPFNPSDANTYHTVSLNLSGLPNEWYPYYTHRIVYESFYDECITGFEIDHLDNNPGNNDISNLEKVTKEENRRRRDLRLGRHLLTDEEILDIQKNATRFKHGRSFSDFARKYGVSRITVKRRFYDQFN